MKRFALNFICKDEAHVITRMLNSVLPVTDLIVALDTGSTDNTIQLIQQFGAQHGIPTYVYERPFDDFASSRNHALDMMRETVLAQGWQLEETYGFWLDCDEEMQFDASFSKAKLTADMYYIFLLDQGVRSTKQCFFKLDKTFRWVGPIHEYIRGRGEFSESLVHGVVILYYREGATWQKNLEEKFLNYAVKLRAYIEEGNRRHRWIWYEGQAFLLAQSHTGDEGKRKYYAECAAKSFEEGLGLEKLKDSQRHLLKVNLAGVREELGSPWTEVKPLLMEAYAADARPAQPFMPVVSHYCEKEQFNTARLYSEFVAAHYHGNEPRDRDLSMVAVDLYKWKLLFMHYEVLSETDLGEAKKVYAQLKACTNAEQGVNLSAEESREILVKAPWIKQLQKNRQRLSAFFRRR